MKKFISLFTTFCIVFAMIGTFTVFSDDTDITEISTLAELEAFRDEVNNGNTYEGKTVRLTADIDMSKKYGEGKESWTPIGTFAGTFDGNGHKIYNLYYYDGTEEYDVENPVGFFKYNNGTIKNLGVEGSITHMKYSVVGGIAAISDGNGMIENCYFSGMITSPAHVGGIVGFGNIKNCYNTATIKGVHCVGGLAGTQSNIVNCYNAGKIIKMTAEDTSFAEDSPYLGSITGCIVYEENVLNCYYLESTYDIGAYTEEGTTDTTTVLTTEQFADKSNFTNWDFDTVWDMDEALGRPVLRSNREQIPVTPTASPTATPTASPTATPTESPTASPTVTPTAEPTPTVSPTASPTASPTTTPISTPKPDFAFYDILKYHSGCYDVRFEKNTDTEITLLLAVYSESGLIAADFATLYSDDLGSQSEWLGNFRASDDIKYVKLFAWNKTMKPLCGAKTYMDADIRYRNMD